MLYVEKGTPAHAFELAFKLSQLDKYELAVHGKDPISALIAPFRYTRDNINTYTVLKDKRVVAMFGVVSDRFDLKKGTVWFLSSDELEENSYYFSKRTKKWCDYFFSDYEYLHNIIIKEHKKNIKWLKWLGFSFKNKKIIVKDVELLFFYKKIHRVSKDIQPILGDIGPIWTTEIS